MGHPVPLTILLRPPIFDPMDTDKPKTEPIHIELERETDGRWIASIECLPGVMAYGASWGEASLDVKRLAANVIGERILHGEDVPAHALGWFYCEGDYHETSVADDNDDPLYEEVISHIHVTVPEGIFVRILDASYQASRQGKLSEIGYADVVQALLVDLREASGLARPTPFDEDRGDVLRPADDIERLLRSIDELRRFFYRNISPAIMRFARHVPDRAVEIRRGIVDLDDSLRCLSDGLERGLFASWMKDAEKELALPYEAWAP